MNKTILITGSGGFVGSNLKKFLQNDFDLLTPRSFQLDLINKQDVIDYFKANQINYVIHCATVGGARGIDDPEDTVNDNLNMLENLILAKDPQTKMILFSSGAMYDKSRALHKVKEEELGLHIPKDLYGKSKMMVAQRIKSRQDVLCLNIFACYGYGEKENRFPTYAIMQNLRKADIVINKNIVFDFLFIEDLQKIIKYFLENESKNNIMNVTPTQSISLIELAEIVNQISDHKSKIIIKDPGLNNEYSGFNSLLLDNYPEISFTSYKCGMEKLYRYYKNLV